MGTKTVPGSVVKGRSNFPEGHFLGTIAEVQGNQESQNGERGFTAFRLINNTAIDAEKEPGGRIHFVNLLTWMTSTNARGKEETIVTSDADLEAEDTPFAVRSAAATLSQLALALGQAEELDDGGVEFNDDLESFIEEFNSGRFEGEEIEFIIEHNTYVPKRGPNMGKKVTFVNTTFVAPEVEIAAEEVKGVVDDEPEEEAVGSGRAKYKRRK